MKTLYITDMDGTLLTREAALSPFSARVINEKLRQGLQFTVATARTITSVGAIMKDTQLSLPVVLMNGTAVYDLSAEKYLYTADLPAAAAARVIGSARRYGADMLVYCLEGNELITYYEEPAEGVLKEFCADRRKNYNRTFLRVEDISVTLERGALYFTMIDTYERLAPVAGALRADGAFSVMFYKDNYNAGMWFLEVMSAQATKGNGVRFLRAHCGFDRVVGFGDNLNDLSLFEACDEKYAVANAEEECKAAADGVIGDCEEDGVAKYLLTL